MRILLSMLQELLGEANPFRFCLPVVALPTASYLKEVFKKREYRQFVLACRVLWYFVDSWYVYAHLIVKY